jgi:hypothetical protein
MPIDSETRGARTWLEMAASRQVVRRAVRVAAVVGSVLVVINHGDALLHGDLSAGRLVRILLTVLVPYCVSTYSSVATLRERFESDVPTNRYTTPKETAHAVTPRLR